MRRAFTLVEFIVVIAIILILAAILFPVFQRPHRGGDRRARCQYQLKQIGLGFMQYVQDYDEKFPSARINSSKGWVDAIQPYVKSTEAWQCPSAPQHAELSTDYFYNRRFSRLSTNKVLKPVQVVLGGDGADDAPYWNSIPQLPSAWATAEPAPSVRHFNGDNGANYLFVDGHVKWKQPYKIKASRPVKDSDVTFAVR